MHSFREIYNEKKDFYSSTSSPYINNFRSSPYSYLKARYYLFFSSILTYFLQNSSVHPNTISKLYIFFGFLGACLLSIPIIEAHYLAIFIIFSKGVLDWTDGHIARLKGMESLTGGILDVYGAQIHSLTFIIGLGMYQYFYFDHNNFFLATLFIYPFCYGTLLTKFSNQYILDSITSENFKKDANFSESVSSIKKQHAGIYSFFSWFLDDRSRTIDFVLLLILMEHFGGPALSWLFFVGVNLKWIALWCGSFIFSSRNGYADKVLASKLSELKDD